jgi:hypothetical protein
VQRARHVAGYPPQPTSESEACEADKGFVLMGRQDFIEVAWDPQGNLLLRQDRLYEGDHELRVSRDYFLQFLRALDVLRKVIVDAIPKARGHEPAKTRPESCAVGSGGWTG